MFAGNLAYVNGRIVITPSGVNLRQRARGPHAVLRPREAVRGQPVTIPVTRLIVVARMLAPNT